MSQPTIDVHAHFRVPGQPVPSPPPWASEERKRDHARHYEQISSLDRIVEESEAAGVDVRVLSLPAASRFPDFDIAPPHLDEIVELNDFLADGVRNHPGKLLGFGTVDAFAGQDGAREVRRVVEDLNLSGIVVDSGKNDVYLGVPETLPTLQEAAALGAPVFVHPTGTGLNGALAEHAGYLGNSYGRGLANGVALLGLIHRGVLDDIPNLQVVFTTLGIGALGIAGTWRAHAGLTEADGRWQVYFDTMGFDRHNVQFQVSLLGAGRVVLGSDFPHQVDATPARVEAALAGLAPEDQDRIRGGNAAALLARTFAPA